MSYFVAIPYSSGQSFTRCLLPNTGVQYLRRNPLFIRSIFHTAPDPQDPGFELDQKSQSLIHQVNLSHIETGLHDGLFGIESQSLIHQVNLSHALFGGYDGAGGICRNPLFIRSIFHTQFVYEPGSVKVEESRNPLFIRSIFHTAPLLTHPITATCKAIFCNLPNL